MNTGFTKLFSFILSSSIWSEDDKTRIVWITMLAMADANGMVVGSLPGIADIARVPIDDAEKAMKKLSSPDKHSRSPEKQGRRIEKVDGGWLIINYRKYRERGSKEARKEYLRNYQRDYMRSVRQDMSNESLTGVQHSASVSEDVKDSDNTFDAKAYNTVWFHYTGGELPFKKACGGLKKLEAIHGREKLVEALDAYLKSTPPKYWSIMRFIQIPFPLQQAASSKPKTIHDLPLQEAK